MKNSSYKISVFILSLSACFFDEAKAEETYLSRAYSAYNIMADWSGVACDATSMFIAAHGSIKLLEAAGVENKVIKFGVGATCGALGFVGSNRRYNALSEKIGDVKKDTEKLQADTGVINGNIKSVKDDVAEVKKDIVILNNNQMTSHAIMQENLEILRDGCEASDKKILDALHSKESVDYRKFKKSTLMSVGANASSDEFKEIENGKEKNKETIINSYARPFGAAAAFTAVLTFAALKSGIVSFSF